MTLIEHIRELRSRLLKACVAIILGAVVAYFFARQIQSFIIAPYCDFMREHNPTGVCQMNTTGVLDQFMLQLKIALYVGLVVSAPFWLYQLWAFIAPGLHKRERRYGYIFAAVATPLFAAGFSLGYVLVNRSMPVFLGLNSDLSVTVNVG